jgi:xanthine dehydrogenase accessory factor
MTGTPASEVRARAAELRTRRVPFVAATVVRAERPTSAKPGDTALVLADGTIVGFVGGECAETSVQVQALSALATGEPVLLRITPDASEAHDPGAVTVHNPCLSGGSLDIFLEPSVPAPLVVVHGDAPIARALADLAGHVGWVAGVEAAADASAVVVASHGRDEASALVDAVRAGVPYVGLVASRRRGAAVVAALDLSDEERAAIRTPAGIDIGARTPEEVALSILAEIVSVRPRPAPHTPPAVEGAATTAIDPICGMTVAAVEGSLHVDVDGTRVWFCGSGCRDAFLAR